jgi:hypothetical protein
MLTVPVGSEDSPVFGGSRELSAKLGVMPFELMLRWRIRALSF